MFHFQAVVFVIGGGNYIEYQNLVDYVKVSALLFLLPLTVVAKNNSKNPLKLDKAHPAHATPNPNLFGEPISGMDTTHKS